MFQFLLGSSSTLIIILFFVYFFFRNPDKFEKWVALFYSALGYFIKKYRRKQIKYDIQANINDYVAKLSRETSLKESMVEIKWAGKDEDDEVSWENDSVVLILRDRGQRNKNFVHAAYFFTSTSLLRNTKLYLSPKQSTSIDIFTTGKIIEESNSAAISYYNQEIANPLMQDSKIKELVEEFQDIDKSGYYSHVLLQELEYLSSKIVLNVDKKQVFQEVAMLIQFLHNFATREVGDDSVAEEFVGKFLRCSIKIVSTSYVRHSGKTQGPANRVVHAFKKGIENIYIIGPYKDGGREFIDSVCAHPAITEMNIGRVRTRSFTGLIRRFGKSKQTLTYLVQLQKSTGHKFIDDSDIYDQIEEYKREIQSEDLSQ